MPADNSKAVAEVVLGFLRSMGDDDNRVVNRVIVGLLEDQRDVVEHLLNKYGPMIEDVATLAALNEVIDYNSIAGNK